MRWYCSWKEIMPLNQSKLPNQVIFCKINLKIRFLRYYWIILIHWINKNLPESGCKSFKYSIQHKDLTLETFNKGNSAVITDGDKYIDSVIVVLDNTNFN